LNKYFITSKSGLEHVRFGEDF